jgi:nucleosome assembly protein 1-like 1
MKQNKLEKEIDDKLVDAILTLPEEVRPRFIALKKHADERNKLNEKLEEEIKALEKKYEQLYLPLYQARRDLIAGVHEVSIEDIAEFKEKTAARKPTEETKVEVDIEELKASKGIPSFWLNAMKNNTLIKTLITEKDEEILKHLIDIRYEQIEDTLGFSLRFFFGPNEHFENDVLTKTYHMEDEGIMEKAESSEIKWKADKDITKKKIKKKQKNKKNNQTRTVMKTVDAESFFNFFKDLKMPEPEKLDHMEEEEEAELAQKMDEDYETACEINEVLIPNALEYYLGIQIEEGYDEFDEGDDIEEEGEEEEGNQPQKNKSKKDKSKGKGGAHPAGSGAGGEAGKPECKQQ